MVNALLNEVAGACKDFAFVIDDYHHITNEDVQAVIRQLIERPSPLHVMLLTRKRPSLPLARLRAQTEIEEIDATQLRFSLAETTKLFNEVWNLHLTAEQCRVLAERTEGWFVGLRLAAYAMRDRRDRAAFVREFSGTNRYIMDYIRQEILLGLPADEERFLVCTSLLERLGGSLCDAVMLRSDSQGILESMEADNVPICALDESRTWYRYHPMFADMLRRRAKQMDVEETREIHRRACRWYAENGLSDAAIPHALDAGDWAQAADLMQDSAADALKRCEPGAVVAWTDCLPTAERKARPILCLHRAIALLEAAPTRCRGEHGDSGSTGGR